MGMPPREPITSLLDLLSASCARACAASAAATQINERLRSSAQSAGDTVARAGQAGTLVKSLTPMESLGSGKLKPVRKLGSSIIVTRR